MLRTEKNISDFQRELMKWGNKNFQKFPWRDIDDPYKILVSEFMLHRTRALQVEPVYSTFIEDYPSLELFSQAKPQDIKEELSTLGLSWRIDNLINALREIHNKYDSVPSNYDILISFHGIGQYIAGATVCFSSNQNALNFNIFTIS